MTHLQIKSGSKLSSGMRLGGLWFYGKFSTGEVAIDRAKLRKVKVNYSAERSDKHLCLVSATR